MKKPHNNDCLQMLQDVIAELAEGGQTALHAQAVKLLQDLQQDAAGMDATEQAGRRYNARQYNNIRFARQAVVTDDCKEPAVIQGLTPQACKLLLLMQSWAQAQAIQVSHDDLVALSGLSDKTCDRAIKELKSQNLITVLIPHKRHEPPVYGLSPAAVCAGKQRHTEAAGEAALAAAKAAGVAVVAKVELVQSQEILGGRYAKVTCDTPPWIEKQPAPTGQVDTGLSTKHNNKHKTSIPELRQTDNPLTPAEDALFTRQDEHEQLPGQMTIYDVLGDDN